MYHELIIQIVIILTVKTKHAAGMIVTSGVLLYSEMSDNVFPYVLEQTRCYNQDSP